MRERFASFVVGILIIGVFYLFILAASLPSYDYLCKADINGNDHCFHSDDGRYVQYFTRNIGIHNRQGSFINLDETLADDIKKIEEEREFINKLKCE